MMYLKEVIEGPIMADTDADTVYFVMIVHVLYVYATQYASCS